MSELKACPFCGVTPKEYSQKYPIESHWVMCYELQCPLFGQHFTIAQWNSRPVREEVGEDKKKGRRG